MRHEALLDRPVSAEDRTPQRAHLKLRADQGSADARAALAGPECPEALDYLLGWARQLVGRSGVGLDGAAPLSYATLDAFERRLGMTLLDHEVAALMHLDAVMRHPEIGEDEPSDEPAPRPAPRWPQKKGT